MTLSSDVDRRLLVVTAAVVVGVGLWVGWRLAGRVRRAG